MLMYFWQKTNRIRVMIIWRKLFSSSALMLFLASASAQVLEGDAISIGDSLTAGLSRASNGVITCIALGGDVVASNQQRTCIGDGQKNIGGWQPALSLALGVDVFNYGNSGEITSTMLSRLSSHMASTPSKYVLILGGTNDVILGVSQATTLSNLSDMIELVRDAGREPIIGTLPPLLGGIRSSKNANIILVNEQIKAFKDIPVADHYSVLIDDWPQNTSGDFLHLGTLGNQIVAEEWERALKSTQKPTVVGILPAINLLLLVDD